MGDFAVLGELVPRLAAEEMVAVTGPAWLLRPDSQTYRQVRLAAAQDAAQRAREYAEAFGGRLNGVVEAADTGLLGAVRNGGQASRPGSASNRGRWPSAPSGTRTWPITPKTQLTSPDTACSLVCTSQRRRPQPIRHRTRYGMAGCIRCLCCQCLLSRLSR